MSSTGKVTIMRWPETVKEQSSNVWSGAVVMFVAAFSGFFVGALVGGALWMVAGFVARLSGVDNGEFYATFPPYWLMGACFLIWVFGVVGAQLKGSFEEGSASRVKDFQRWQEEERKWQELKRQKPE